jgi:two-component system sensor histidine kinase BarA
LAAEADAPILVVDDIATNRRVLRAFLTQMGFRHIIEASDGAMMLATVQIQWPALVLMDLFMPVMDGFEAARRLRALPGGERLPIVAVSASVIDKAAMEAELTVFNDFLPKPFRAEELHNILALHGGFHFSLTEAKGEPAPSRESSTAAVYTQQELPSSRRVLVVDDQILNQKLASALLKRAGHTVEVCSSGSEAVNRLEKEWFDVVLMDVRMPEMDGLEATRRIRAATGTHASRPLIIGMSADSTAEVRTACKNAGMDCFLGKPFQARELVGMVTGRMAQDGATKVA